MTTPSVLVPTDFPNFDKATHRYGKHYHIAGQKGLWQLLYYNKQDGNCSMFRVTTKRLTTLSGISISDVYQTDMNLVPAKSVIATAKEDKTQDKLLWEAIHTLGWAFDRLYIRHEMPTLEKDIDDKFIMDRLSETLRLMPSITGTSENPIISATVAAKEETPQLKEALEAVDILKSKLEYGLSRLEEAPPKKRNHFQSEYNYKLRLLKTIRAALSQSKDGWQIPTGYALVPIEPNKELCIAFSGDPDSYDEDTQAIFNAGYKAMIAAAPVEGD